MANLSRTKEALIVNEFRSSPMEMHREEYGE